MSNGITPGFLTLLVPIILFAASGASSENEKTGPGAQKRYESPKEVFDAYRKAREKRDYRTIFLLSSPKRQNDAVYEAFFACMEQGSKEMGPLVPKYVDMTALGEDYEKQYKKKHGIDFAKFSAEHQHDQTFVPPPPHDDQLWYDAVVSHVKDKLGFCLAVGKHFDERDAKNHAVGPISPLGDMEHLVVKGDTATGRAKETLLPNVAAGESPLKPGQSPAVYDKPFEFRRVNGCWLLDSL